MEISRDVMIVEDDECTRSLLAAILEYHGYRVTAASDGDGAMARLSIYDFPILVLDLLLPNRNGFDVLRHIKCTNPDLLARTLVITAASASTTRDCQELRDVRKFFPKPLEVDEFVGEMLALTAELALKSAIPSGALDETRTSGRKERET